MLRYAMVRTSNALWHRAEVFDNGNVFELAWIGRDSKGKTRIFRESVSKSDIVAMKFFVD